MYPYTLKQLCRDTGLKQSTACKFIDEIKEKQRSQESKTAAFADKNDWVNSFKTVEVLGLENTPAFAVILNRINQAYEFTLKQSLESMDTSQQTKILKEVFIQKY